MVVFWKKSGEKWRYQIFPYPLLSGKVAFILQYRLGQFAPWIAAPKSGVDGKTGNFEYVRMAV